MTEQPVRLTREEMDHIVRVKTPTMLRFLLAAQGVIVSEEPSPGTLDSVVTKAVSETVKLILESLGLSSDYQYCGLPYERDRYGPVYCHRLPHHEGACGE